MKTLGETDSDLDFSTQDGLRSVVQRVTQRLRFWRGEWFLDTAEGIPYIADVIGHDVNIELAKQAITAQIRTVPDVLSVDNVQVGFDFRTRTLLYSATIKTEFGAATVSLSPEIPETDLQPATSAPPHHIPVSPSHPDHPDNPNHPDHPDNPANQGDDFWTAATGDRWTSDNLGGVEFWTAGAHATSGNGGQYWTTGDGAKWTSDDDGGTNYWGE